MVLHAFPLLALFCMSVWTNTQGSAVVAKLGLKDDGAPTAIWLSVVKNRLSQDEYELIQKSKKPLSMVEKQWMQFITGETSEWICRV
ncbi:MAG: hypothetical protein HY537_18095 [Deltaproteobacteria bacterium]|nr:hypothetical protein [Deltaproteobacteria bacterium]